MLQSDEHGSAPFAAHSKPLNNAEHREENWRSNTDRRGWWQQADGHGGTTHEHHRRHEHTLAPDLVTTVPQDNATARAANVADRTDGEGPEAAKAWIEVNEVDLTEYDRRRGGEEDEVVELDHRAQEARCENTTHHRRIQRIREIFRSNLFGLRGRCH